MRVNRSEQDPAMKTIQTHETYGVFINGLLHLTKLECHGKRFIVLLCTTVIFVFSLSLCVCVCVVKTELTSVCGQKEPSVGHVVVHSVTKAQ